jgi:hypothetical protein
MVDLSIHKSAYLCEEARRSKLHHRQGDPPGPVPMVQDRDLFHPGTSFSGKAALRDETPISFIVTQYYTGEAIISHSIG